MELTFAK